jgi:transcriptional regulator with XRE-family HTH domain
MNSDEFKELRKRHFKTQQEAADYFQVSFSLIEKYERGKNPIRLIHAIAFRAILTLEELPENPEASFSAS